MKTTVTTLVLSLLLNACGTTEKRPSDMEAGMAAWVGKTYTEYTAAKGAPKLTIVETGGAKTLEYVRERILHRHATANVMMPISIANGVVVMAPAHRSRTGRHPHLHLQVGGEIFEQGHS